jgi:transposase
MKKVSTAAAKQSKNFSQQKLTIGLDLGDRNSWYCVVDEAGQIQLEQRVRTTAKALQEIFAAMPRSRIALEIGTHSPWISRLLRELGHEVIVANARKVRLIGESRKKDDRLDAQTLARLARIDPQLLYPVKHRSAQAQADALTPAQLREITGIVLTAVRGIISQILLILLLAFLFIMEMADSGIQRSALAERLAFYRSDAETYVAVTARSAGINALANLTFLS